MFWLYVNYIIHVITQMFVIMTNLYLQYFFVLISLVFMFVRYKIHGRHPRLHDILNIPMNNVHSRQNNLHNVLIVQKVTLWQLKPALFPWLLGLNHCNCLALVMCPCPHSHLENLAASQLSTNQPIQIIVVWYIPFILELAKSHCKIP